MNDYDKSLSCEVNKAIGNIIETEEFEDTLANNKAILERRIAKLIKLNTDDLPKHTRYHYQQLIDINKIVHETAVAITNRRKHDSKRELEESIQHKEEYCDN